MVFSTYQNIQEGDAMDPYIGITDFSSYIQVQEMLAIFNHNKRPGSKRKLHVGVMMSYKTLHDIPSKWQDAFPPKERIAGIFSSDETYNCLHYADYENRPDLAQNLEKAIAFGGDRIHALQLDMIWPDPDEISKAIDACPKNIELILQVGKNALEEVSNDPQTMAERLKNYQGLIRRVLLDKSMGRGLGMDAEELIPFAWEIWGKFPELGIACAGGLGPKTMHLVKPLAELFPNMSIDAQGQLRPSGNALDPIDWTMAKDYLIKALRIFH